MAKRPRRNHSPQFKAEVVLAAPRGEQTMAKLAQKFEDHADQIAKWKAQLWNAPLKCLKAAILPRIHRWI